MAFLTVHIAARAIAWLAPALVTAAAGSAAAPALAAEPCLIIGHRGSPVAAPENTLASFRQALGENADGFEADFHLTGDGEVVALHDKSTKRTTGVPGRVADMTFDDARRLDAGAWKGSQFAGEKLPTLRETLALVPPGKTIYLEVKVGPEILPRMSEEMAASGLEPGQMVVISFHDNVVAAVKRDMPETKAYLLHRFEKDKQGRWTSTPDEVMARLEKINADGLDVAADKASREMVDEELAKKLAEAGVELHVYGVDEPAEARRVIALGAKSITTDHPGRLATALAQGRTPPSAQSPQPPRAARQGDSQGDGRGDKMNVLFIAVDDLNMRLETFGFEQVKTPNLDELAAQGVRFNRAYCQLPLCNPSRASLLTGLRPDTIKVRDLGTDFRRAVPDAVTLPQMFMNNGYFVARVGKIYHYGVPRQIGTDGPDDIQSWDVRVNPRGRDKNEEARVVNITPYGQDPLNSLGFAMAWMDVPGTEQEQTDGISVTAALDLMEQHRDEPFFMAVGFFRPHTPWVATREFFDMYPLSEVRLPDVPEDDLADVPPPAYEMHPPDYSKLEPVPLRDIIRSYYASTTQLDVQVGRLLDGLEELGLKENTVIVFWSDHGFMLGEHGLWQKEKLFEEAVQVPLIISTPQLRAAAAAGAAGAASDRVVELLDIYPTLADLCGLEPPENLEGRSLRPLLQDPDARWDHPAYSQVWRGGDRDFMGYSVRDERWRYTEWDGGDAGVELYDHQNDPQEHNNLAENPEYARERARLSELLDEIR